ncbi:MAG: hypothetical protein V3V15_05285 [Sphingorhabdus sp.]
MWLALPHAARLGELIGLDHWRLRNHITAVTDYNIFFWQDNFAWLVCAATGLIALIAGYADRRRQKRADIEKVGFMPWTTITVLAGTLAFAFLIYALTASPPD